MTFKEIDSMDKIEGSLEDGDYLAAIELTDTEGKLAAQFYSFEPLTLSVQQDLTAQLETAGQLYAISQMNLTNEQALLLMDTAPIIGMTTFNNEDSNKTADEKWQECSAPMQRVLSSISSLFHSYRLSQRTWQAKRLTCIGNAAGQRQAGNAF